MKALDLKIPKMFLDVDFDPVLTELWPWEGKKLNLENAQNESVFVKFY